MELKTDKTLVLKGHREHEIAFAALLLNGLIIAADLFLRGRVRLLAAVAAGKATKADLARYSDEYFAKLHGPAIKDGHKISDEASISAPRNLDPKESQWLIAAHRLVEW